MHKTLIIVFLTAVISEPGPRGGTAAAETSNTSSSRGTAILAVFSQAGSPYHTVASPPGASWAQMSVPDGNQQDSHLKTDAQSNGFTQTPSISFGRGANDPNFSLGTDGAGTRELFLKMMVSVVIVVGLGAAAIYGSRRLMGKITNLPGKRIRIVETTHLGPRKAVHLLKVGDRCLLLGSTNDSITKLADLTTEFVIQDNGFAVDSGAPGSQRTAGSTEFDARLDSGEALPDLSTAYTENN